MCFKTPRCEGRCAPDRNTGPRELAEVHAAGPEGVLTQAGLTELEQPIKDGTRIRSAGTVADLSVRGPEGFDEQLRTFLDVLLHRHESRSGQGLTRQGNVGNVQPGRVGVQDETRRREPFGRPFFWPGVLQILLPRQLHIRPHRLRYRDADVLAELQLPSPGDGEVHRAVGMVSQTLGRAVEAGIRDGEGTVGQGSEYPGCSVRPKSPGPEIPKERREQLQPTLQFPWVRVMHGPMIRPMVTVVTTSDQKTPLGGPGGGEQ